MKKKNDYSSACTIKERKKIEKKKIVTNQIVSEKRRVTWFISIKPTYFYSWINKKKYSHVRIYQRRHQSREKLALKRDIKFWFNVKKKKLQ